MGDVHAPELGTIPDTVLDTLDLTLLRVYPAVPQIRGVFERVY